MSRHSASRRAPAKIGPWLVAVVGAGFLAGAVILFLRSPGGASTATPQQLTTGGRAWFEDVAAARGLVFTYASGQGGSRKYMPEIMGGGACLADFDRDGFLDVFLPQGGKILPTDTPNPADRLFRNDGAGQFVDITASAGLTDTGYSMGCTVGDFDDDGWPDLYVTNVGPNALYRNNHNGTFTDVTVTAGVADPGFSASAAFVDYDRDGDLDLYVANYVGWTQGTELDCSTASGDIDYCKPTHYNAPQLDTLYRNNGDGTFTDASAIAGIDKTSGNGLGVVCTDVDDDGWVDILVANDENPNTLWLNQRDGTLRDVALERGLAYNSRGEVDAGMGVDLHDFELDGDLDLFVTHFAGELNTAYINQNGYFDDRTAQFGLSSALPYTGFGVGFHDFDLDSFSDLYVANGRVVIGYGDPYRTHPYAEPNQLWRGRQDGTFEEVMPRGGTSTLLVDPSRGAAFGDLDNDGRVDVVVINRDAPAYVLRNRLSTGHWVGFEVLGSNGSPAIGARLTTKFDGKPRVREVRVACSYCSANDPRVHFGLGEHTRLDSLDVLWPDGTRQQLGPFEAGRYYRVERGKP